MLEQLSPPVKGLVLDMDGVLWKDSAPIGDLASIFTRMQAAGLKVMLATNNGTMTVDQYLKKLAGFGVRLEGSQIITSANALAAILSKAYPAKGAVYVVGEEGVVAALCEAGFAAITDPDDETPAVAVVAGLDRQLSYGKLRRAMFNIRAGASFYGTNPDPTFPTPLGPVPGAGSILAAIQTASATNPIVIGKPSPYMLSLCAERMQLDPKEMLVVGDRLETDIAGGQALGARTALVLSGISNQTQADRWVPRPDLVARDLTELVGP
jgi:4-nitrophenyl phosphatase